MLTMRKVQLRWLQGRLQPETLTNRFIVTGKKIRRGALGARACNKEPFPPVSHMYFEENCSFSIFTLV